MYRLLIAVDGSTAALCAVRQAIREYRSTSETRIVLLNVRPKLSRYVARHLSLSMRERWYLDEADKALGSARALLDHYRIPYSIYMKKGCPAREIVTTAAELRCTRILMGTTRKKSLHRFLAASLTTRVLELTEVPVEVIVGEEAPRLHSIGVPAGVGLGLASLIMLALD